MARGPISCGIDAMPLLKYQGGVATDPGSGVDHVISVVGWGQTNDSEGKGYVCRNENYWGRRERERWRGGGEEEVEGRGRGRGREGEGEGERGGGGESGGNWGIRRLRASCLALYQCTPRTLC